MFKCQYKKRDDNGNFIYCDNEPKAIKNYKNEIVYFCDYHVEELTKLHNQFKDSIAAFKKWKEEKNKKEGK